MAVAYSHVERDWFPNDEAYEAEREVEMRAQEVLQALEKLGVPAKPYPGDQYFFTNLLVDDPSLVLNLVDTLRGRDALQTSVPAALELANIPYTGAGMQGLVIGNEGEGMRRLVRQSCDYLLRLPMRGEIESLNASVAGSIALYLAWQARGFSSG